MGWKTTVTLNRQRAEQLYLEEKHKYDLCHVSNSVLGDMLDQVFGRDWPHNYLVTDEETEEQ